MGDFGIVNRSHRRGAAERYLCVTGGGIDKDDPPYGVSSRSANSHMAEPVVNGMIPLNDIPPTSPNGLTGHGEMGIYDTPRNSR